MKHSLVDHKLHVEERKECLAAAPAGAGGTEVGGPVVLQQVSSPLQVDFV